MKKPSSPRKSKAIPEPKLEKKASIQILPRNAVILLCCALAILAGYSFFQLMNANQAIKKERVSKIKAEEAFSKLNMEKFLSDSISAEKVKAFQESLTATQARDSAIIRSKNGQLAQARLREKAIELKRFLEATEAQKTLAQIKREEAEKQELFAFEAKKRADSLGALLQNSEVMENLARERADQLYLLSIAQAVAIKSLQMRDPQLRALVSLAAYEIHVQNTSPTQLNNPYIYESLFESLKKFEEKGFNIIGGYPIPANAGAIYGLQFLGNGNELMTLAANGQVARWDVEDVQQSLVHVIKSGLDKDFNKVFAINSDEKVLVTAGIGNNLRVYEIKPGQTDLVNTIKNGNLRRDLNCMLFLPDKKMILMAGEESTIQLWDIEKDAPDFIVSVNSPVKAMVLSEDGKYLFTGDSNGHLMMWTFEGNQLKVKKGVINLNTGIHCLAIQPGSGLLAIGRKDGLLSLYQPGNGIMLNNPVRNLEGHASTISCLAFNSSGDKLVSGSYDRTVRVWGFPQLRNAIYQPLVFKDHSSRVTSVSFHKSGQFLVAGCSNGEVKMWDLDAERLAEKICKEGKISRELNETEWEMYFEDIPKENYQAKCQLK